MTAAVDLASALRAEESADPGRAPSEAGSFEESLTLAERSRGDAAPAFGDGASGVAGRSAPERSDERVEPIPSEAPPPPAEAVAPPVQAPLVQAPLELARSFVPEVRRDSELEEVELPAERASRLPQAPLDSEADATHATRAGSEDLVEAGAATGARPGAERGAGLEGGFPRAGAAPARETEVRSPTPRGPAPAEASPEDAPPGGPETAPRELPPAAASAAVAPPASAPRRASVPASPSSRAWADAPSDGAARNVAEAADAAALQPQGAAEGTAAEPPAAPTRRPTPGAPEDVRAERNDRSERTSPRDRVDRERADEPNAPRALDALRAPVAEVASASSPSAPPAPIANPGAWLATVQPAPVASGAAAEPLPTPPAEAVPLHVEWLAARGGGAARLRLHPPELGEIDVSVRVRDGAVQVVIRALEPAAQRLVAEGRVGLVDALAARDLRVETFQVLTADGEARDETTGRESALGDPREGAAERDEGRPGGNGDRGRSLDFAGSADRPAAHSAAPTTGADRSRIDLRI